MRVVIEKPPEGGEEELIVRVNQLSERVLELLRVIQAEDEKLMCYHEDGSLSGSVRHRCFILSLWTIVCMRMKKRRCRN